MNIEEFADILGVNLIITRYANQGGRYTAKFDGVEVKRDKHDVILCGLYGKSKSSHEAVADYVENIRGKWLVINAYQKEKRREFGVPDTLTVF